MSPYMSLTCHALYIICLQLTLVVSQITRTVQLTPNTVSSTEDISVTLGPGATIISNVWSIDVESQYGTDLNIHLGPSWGFNPTYPSSIDLFINGNTSNETYNNDGEILFIFNTNNKYFAQMISIDSKPLAYRECPTSYTPLINTNMTKILASSTPDRYHRYCNNTHPDIDHWTVPNGITYKKAAQWPMFMSITNDPILNNVSYSWGDITDNVATKVSSQYTSSFDTNEGVNIYISGENYGEDFFIHSIDILYRYIGTTHPTNTPTLLPTSLPTTIRPTNAPTVLPTSYPTTIPPTDAPTVLPTPLPSTVRPTTAIPTTYVPTTAVTSSISTIDDITSSLSTIEDITSSLSTIDDVISSLNTENTTEDIMSTTETVIIETVIPSVIPTLSLPPLEVTERNPTSTLIVNTDVKSTVIDGDGPVDESLKVFGNKLLYIVAISIAVTACICFIILYFGLKQIKQHEDDVSGKEYKGVRVIRKKSTSLEPNDTCPDPVQIKVDGGNYKHTYKSSDEVYPHNKFYNNSMDFSRNLSSAVTEGDHDEMMMVTTAPGVNTETRRSHTSDDDVLASNRTDTFKHDIDHDGREQMMTYTHKGLEYGTTAQYRYNEQYEYGVNKHQYYGYNEEEAQLKRRLSSDELMNVDDIGAHGTHGQYEIGMVTMSKISEIAPHSKGSNVGIGNLSQNVNNDSLIMEGNEFNDDYVQESDELMNMETAGFIDGDYNELEYEDEYYEDDD